MNFPRSWILAAALLASGCVTIRQSTPPEVIAGAQITVATSADMPTSDQLPQQSATAPGTKYVVIQAAGGSLLLGPLLGALNVAANTRAMADKYKDSLLAIDPTPLAASAIAEVGIGTAAAKPTFVVKPFVVVQHCYDDRFRLSLVFHVEDAGTADRWIGRYTYHLPTSYPASRFGQLGERDTANYRSELASASAVLANLMKRDLAGELPATGKKVKFGSLHIMGNKLGAAGIYTMPQELHIPDAELIEETRDHVTLRLRGAVGGMAFGVHRIDRRLIHTLKPARAS